VGEANLAVVVILHLTRGIAGFERIIRKGNYVMDNLDMNISKNYARIRQEIPEGIAMVV